MVRVSVIVAVYNVIDYVEKCLISIKNQTYREIEVIVVDDGSKDGSGLICDKFANEDSRFFVIHKENAGLGYARNSALERASGDFVLFIDGDDFIDENMVEILVKYQSEYHSDMVICGFKRYIDDQNIRDCIADTKVVTYSGDNEISEKVLCPIIGLDPLKNADRRREMCVWTNLYSLKLINDNYLRFVSEREYLSEDFFFNISYINKCRKVTIVPECLYYYRYNPDSLSNAYRPNRVDLLNKMMSKAKELLKDEGIAELSENRLQSTYFMKLRNAMLQICTSSLSVNEKRKKIDEAITSDQCIAAVSAYPLYKVKVSDFIMLKLIKARKSIVLFYYLRLQVKALKIRNAVRNR